MKYFLSITQFSKSVLGYYDYYLILKLCKKYNIHPVTLPGRKYPRFHISQVQQLLTKLGLENDRVKSLHNL
jgi:hypothetical protein